MVEFHIESAPSELNPHLYVSLHRGRLQLATAHAIYSYEDLYDNFARVIELINWQTFKPKNLLVLGGGLLSVNYMLQKYLPLIESTVVEYDEQVIYLASKYILHKIHAPLNIVQADAVDFVISTKQTYDLIIVDIFDDDKIPARAKSSDFLKKLSSICTDKGLIIYNCLANTVQDKEKSRAFFENKFNLIFSDAVLKDVQGNYMLLHTDQYLK